MLSDRFDDLSQGFRSNQCFVTLQVHDDIRLIIQGLDGHRDAIRGTPAGVLGHQNLAAEAFGQLPQFFVRRGDIDFVEGPAKCGPPIDMLDHGMTGDQGERLALEAVGVKSGGDNADITHKVGGIVLRDT